LNLFPSVELEHDVIREREHDREALLSALQNEGLKPARPSTPAEPWSADLARALHLYLARSATALVALQIEDLLGMVDPVNVPGTDREYPNWQRKLSAELEEMEGRADFAAYFEEMRRARE